MAIFAIVMMIAVPSFVDAAAKAQVLEGTSVVAGIKAKVEEHYKDNGAVPSGPQIGVSGTAATLLLSNVPIMYRRYCTDHPSQKPLKPLVSLRFNMMVPTAGLEPRWEEREFNLLPSLSIL